MCKIPVHYYSTYGHVETMAQEIARGVSLVLGVTVDVKRVPEWMSEEAARGAGAKIDQIAPTDTVNELTGYAAHGKRIVKYGRSTRRVAARSRNSGGADGCRQPSAVELEIACAQGVHAAKATLQLLLGRQVIVESHS